MASKDDKGREDLDDLGLKDKFLFQLMLKFSDLDLLKTHVIKMQKVQFQFEMRQQREKRSKNEYIKKI